MAKQEWVTTGNFGGNNKFNEETTIDLTVEYKATTEVGHRTVLTKVLSSTVPSDIDIYDFEVGKTFKVKGTLPKITENVTYYFTSRLTEYDSSNNVVSVDDRCFEIVSLNVPVTWKAQETEFTATTNTEFSQELLLNNANGNEVFKKVSGSLPSGVTLNQNGSLTGSIFEDDIEDTPYTCEIAVYVGSEQVCDTKTFTINVVAAAEDTPPYWITEPGMIGNVDFDKASSCKIIAMDLNGKSTVSYILADDDDPNCQGDETGLPPGLSLVSTSESEGAIQGIVTTTQVKEWIFGAYAQKYYEGVMIKSPYRRFIISTNQVSEEHRITWGDASGVIDGGTYTIGSIVSDKLPEATVPDGSTITYSLSGTGYPKGLVVNSDGTLNGNIDYPEEVLDGTKQLTENGIEYYFSVMAKTSYTYVVRTVKITVKPGLGYNALRSYLRINLEYKDEYNEIKQQLNETTKYKPLVSDYIVDTFPTIDVATLAHYDTQVLNAMMSYGNPEILRFLETKSKTYSQIDSNGDSVANYEIFYKGVDENTYQWDDIENGDYTWEESLCNKIAEDVTGEELYEKLSNGYFREGTRIFFNNIEYDSESWEKANGSRETLYCVYENVDGSYYVVDVNTDPDITYNVFNFLNARNALSQSIYVYQKPQGTYYYDVGSQELFSNVTTYSTQLLYTVGENYYISNEDGTNVQQVLYENHIVTNLSGTPIRNILFKPTFDSPNFMILSTDNEVYHLEEIDTPWCYDFDNNTLEIPDWEEGKEMVLPQITEDYKYDPTCIQDGVVKLLDTTLEPLPVWKREDAITWTPSTVYYTNDIITYNLVYYRVKQQFTSDTTFRYDTNVLELLNGSGVKEALAKKYYPTLDLGYYESGTNRHKLTILNNAEINEGKYWYRRDFMFWELICEPKYTDVNNFGVPFYSTEDVLENVERPFKDRTFTIVCTLDDVSVKMYANDVEVTPTHIGTTWSITVEDGTKVGYKVSKSQYYTEEDSYVLVNDEVVEITLEKECVVTVSPLTILKQPLTGCTITLLADGYTQVGDHITVREGTAVAYSVSKDGYLSVEGALVATEFEETIYPIIKKFVTLTLEVYPSTATYQLTLIATGYTQEGNTITVPEGTKVTYNVNASIEWTSKSGTVIVDNDMTYTVSVSSNAYTFTINPTPPNANVVISCPTGKISQTTPNSMVVSGGAPITYSVTLDGYEGKIDVPVNAGAGIMKDTTLNVEIKKYVRFTITPNPTDSTVILTCPGYTQPTGENYIIVTDGKAVTYKVNRFGYKSTSGSQYVTEDTVKAITLTDLMYIVPEYTTLDALVLEANENQPFMTE